VVGGRVDTVTHDTQSHDRPGARPPGYYRWPLLIIGLVGLQLLMAAITVYFATNDRSFAVVPDAYSRALSWDEQSQARLASEALGWTYELRIGEPDTIGDRYLFVTLLDADGQPIEAEVEGQAFHRARAQRRLDFTCRQVTPGQFRAKLAMRRDGVWVVKLTARRGDDVALVDTTVYVGQWRPN
jgi:nitrogen fixation protein FixH